MKGSHRLSEQAGLRVIGCSYPHFPDRKTEAGGGGELWFKGTQRLVRTKTSSSMRRGRGTGGLMNPGALELLLSCQAPGSTWASHGLLPRHREQARVSGTP